MTTTKFKAKIIIPLGVTLFFLLAVSVHSIYWFQQKHADKSIRDSIAGLNKLFQMELAKDADLLNALLDRVESDEVLQRAWLDRDREELTRQSSLLFEAFREKFRVTHFYIIDPAETCFLRVHNPARYGDRIQRFTLDHAARDGKAAYGVELGPLGTFTLRVVRPWRIGGSLAGYLELGEEIDQITPDLKRILGVDLFFCIDKAYLDRRRWEEGLGVTGRSGSWDQVDQFVVIGESPPIFHDKPGEDLNSVLSLDGQSVIRIHDDTRVYQAGAAPLVDAGGRAVGKMVLIKDGTEEEAALRRATVSQAFSALMVGIVLFFLLYRIVSQVEKKLSATEAGLKKEVEQRRQTENTLRESENKHRTLFESSRDAIMILKPEKGFTDGNPAAVAMFGCRDRKEFITLTPEALSPERQPDGAVSSKKADDMIAEADRKGAHSFEWVHKKLDGTKFFAAVLITRIALGDGTFFQATVRDITENKRAQEKIERTNEKLEWANQKLEKLSLADGLTEIGNRRYFDQALEKEFRRSLRHKTPLGLIMIDLDYFKNYNDHYGHLKGDECLKRVAQELTTIARRSSDVVARYGGEEFAVILPEATHDIIEHLAEKARKAVMSLNIPHAASPSDDCVTITLGCASVVPAGIRSAEALVEAADRALYQAKRAGRNRAVMERLSPVHTLRVSQPPQNTIAIKGTS